MNTKGSLLEEARAAEAEVCEMIRMARWLPAISLLRNNSGWCWSQIYDWLRDEGEPVPENEGEFIATVGPLYEFYLLTRGSRVAEGTSQGSGGGVFIIPGAPEVSEEWEADELLEEAGRAVPGVCMVCNTMWYDAARVLMARKLTWGQAIDWLRVRGVPQYVAGVPTKKGGR